MLIVILAWLGGFAIPDILGLTELYLLSRYGIIKGHLYTISYTNGIRLITIVILFLLSKKSLSDVFLIGTLDPVVLVVFIIAALILAIILLPRKGIKIIEEISFYYKKIGKIWPLFVFNRYLLHLFHIITISFMVMVLNEYLNPLYSGLIAGGLWSLVDLFLRNYRFGIYNILLSVILSFSYNHFGSFSVTIIIGIIPQII